MAGRKIRDEADARECLKSASASGVTRVAWARAHGVDARSLQAWRLILERKEVSAQPVEFLELVPTPSPSGPPNALRVSKGGLVVDVPAEFDERHLLRVLQVLLAC